MFKASLGLWIGGVSLLATACSPGQITEPSSQNGEPEVAVQEQAALKQDVALDKELFVTHLSVVADARYTAYQKGKADAEPEGGWSFARLFENLMPSGKNASAAQRSQFVLGWLRLWEQDQVVNGLTVPARPAIRNLVIDPWKAVSGCTGADSDCLLDMAKAPFRLDSIVFRPDLRRVPRDGYAGRAGEGRFIFTVLGANGSALPFTVIFEYIIPISKVEDILAIAQSYHKLGKLNFGSDFNEKLFALTTNFTKWNVANGRPNGSALSQIRTNEVALNPVWEMREFVLTPGGDRLVQDTVKNEPAAHHNDSPLMAVYATTYQQSILDGKIDMPATFQSLPWLAGSALVPFGLQWKIPGATEAVRKSVALSTCSGCHLSETRTPFVHVMAPDVRAFLRKEPPPAQRGAAILSSFLTQELQGPRLADYTELLASDGKKIKDGPGRDHK